MRKSILDSLFSKTRQNILNACLLNPDRWWSLSELAEYLEVTASSLQRELLSLSNSQILETKKESNRVYYKANLASPIIDDLQSVLVKTSGLIDQIKTAFRGFDQAIDFSFVYGSFARNEAIATSDVDVMVVGGLKLTEISVALKKIEKKVSREINVTLFTKKEFARRLREQDGFIKTVLLDKKIFLKGSDDELKAMA